MSKNVITYVTFTTFLIVAVVSFPATDPDAIVPEATSFPEIPPVIQKEDRKELNLFDGILLSIKAATAPTKETCLPLLCGDHTMDSLGATPSGLFITQTSDAVLCKTFGGGCKAVEREGGTECHYDSCFSKETEACAREFSSFDGTCSDEDTKPDMKELFPFIRECQAELPSTDKCGSHFDPLKCDKPTGELIADCEECKNTLMQCTKDKFIAAKTAASMGSDMVGGDDMKKGETTAAMDLEGQKCASTWTDCMGCHSTGAFCGTPSGTQGEEDGHAAVVVCGEENCPKLDKPPATGSGAGPSDEEDGPDMEILLPFIRTCQAELPSDNACATLDPLSCETEDKPICATCKAVLTSCVERRMKADLADDSLLSMPPTTGSGADDMDLLSMPPTTGSGADMTPIQIW